MIKFTFKIGYSQIELGGKDSCNGFHFSSFFHILSRNPLKQRNIHTHMLCSHNMLNWVNDSKACALWDIRRVKVTLLDCMKGICVIPIG